MIDAYLVQRPHENTVIDFTGVATADFSIAIVAGLNRLTHCAELAGVPPAQQTGTLRHFRKLVTLALKWWLTEGAVERCAQMLANGEQPPLMLYLVWSEYTRLAKQVAAAAIFRIVHRAFAEAGGAAGRHRFPFRGRQGSGRVAGEWIVSADAAIAPCPRASYLWVTRHRRGLKRAAVPLCQLAIQIQIFKPAHVTHHIRFKSVEDLRLRLQGAERHQSRHRPRRDFCAAGAERRRQDHADQHHLRHRQPERRAASPSAATTSTGIIAPRAR